MSSPAVTLDAALFSDSLVKKVQSLIDKADASGEKVAAWDEIQQVLTDGKLGYFSQVPCDFVGVHESNRSKLGVGGSEAHHHGADILKMGFSWKKASSATAFECPPAPFDDEAQKHNASWVELSGGLIPPLTQLKLLSVGGGHTNSFLRAVQAGCPSAVADLADAHGNLSREALTVDRPAFKEALDKGLKSFVLNWQCQYAWPRLPDFIQGALNTEARNQQSEIEIMLAMHEAMMHALDSGKDVDWKVIQSTAGHCLPKCAPYIPTLASYVQNNGGGITAELLKELSQHQNTFKCNQGGVSRAMGSEFWMGLTRLNFGVAERCPYIQNAAVKANLCAPPNKIMDGFCRLITANMLSQLASKENKPKTFQAEKIMADARELIKALPGSVSEKLRVKLLGQLDVRCVTHILKKG